MSKEKYAESFNDWLVKFFRELIKMYPSNYHFKDAKTQIMLVSQTPQFQLPITYFEKYLSPYRDHLYDKNEKFFLEFDLTGSGIEYLNYVKDLWQVADDRTKETMWKYFI